MNPRLRFYCATLAIIFFILAGLFAIIVLSMPAHPNLRAK